MNDSKSDSHIQTFKVLQTGAIISSSVHYYDREGNRLAPRRSTSRSGPAARAVRSPHGQYDPRIEFILMRSGRRLGVEYRRFIGGKLALTGFVEEPGPSDYDPHRAGEIEEFHEFNPVGVPKARLEQMAQFALEKILECD